MTTEPTCNANGEAVHENSTEDTGKNDGHNESGRTRFHFACSLGKTCCLPVVLSSRNSHKVAWPYLRLSL